MVTSFHSFSRLPPELRRQIWALTAELRNVCIRTIPKSSIFNLATYPQSAHAPLTTPPAVMHVCQESRQQAPYQKAFFTTIPGDESKVRYVWFNFQQDMVCLADCKVELLAPHEADIQRLRFTVPDDDFGDVFYEYFFHHSHKMLEKFTALRELHLAIGHSFLIWGSTVGSPAYGQCPPENVRFLDLETGLLLTGPQLEMAYHWAEQYGGKVLDVDDFDEELRLMLDNETRLNLSELADID